MSQSIPIQQADYKTYPVPSVLNTAILFSAAIVSVYLLKFCNETHLLFYKILGGLLFSFTANTLFSLLHEAVHGHLHANEKMNHLLGMICAAFYPTSFSLQRAYHLSHHKNNRTSKEQFDYVNESDNKFIKYAQWYCILTGLYWVFAVLGAFLVLLIPGFLIQTISKSKLSKQTGADSMFARLSPEIFTTIRLELLFSIGVQLLIFYWLDISFVTYLICYGLFAINWSSLQYADHAFTALDPKEGAWNLRVTKFTQLLFLNYHAHKIHHKNMHLPWLYLYRFVPKDEYKPKFISVYLQMWKGPRKMPANLVEANQYHPAFTHLNGEWTSLKEFYHFSRRNLRYFKIALFLYLPALFQYRKLRTFRYGFSLLQHIDDVMDGDRKFEGDPLEMTAALKKQIQQEIFEPTRTGILAAVLFKSIQKSKINKEELKTEVLTLIEIMEFDYKRRAQKIILSNAELEKVLTGTFYHSINLAMVLWQSDLRAKDANCLINCFSWCTVIRDFRDDLELGIINIPAEVMKEANLSNFDSADTMISNSVVQHWILENYKQIGPMIADSTQQLNELKGRKGAFLLRIFHNSIQDYHKKFHLLFPKL